MSYLYAHTNGTLSAQVFIDEICADLGIVEATLRRRRAELAAAGYLASERVGETLTYELRDPERAPTARSEEAQRAPTARSVDDNAHLLRDERAPSARSETAQRAPTARSPRQTAAQVPPTPPNELVKYAAGGPTTTKHGKEREETRRAANVLLAAGVEAQAAEALAAQHGLRAVACHVAGWQAAQAKTDLGVGALIHRITKWPVPRPTAAQLRAGILETLIDDDDLIRWKFKTDPLAGYTVPDGYEGLIQT